MFWCVNEMKRAKEIKKKKTLKECRDSECSFCYKIWRQQCWRRRSCDRAKKRAEPTIAESRRFGRVEKCRLTLGKQKEREREKLRMRTKWKKNGEKNFVYIQILNTDAWDYTYTQNTSHADSRTENDRHSMMLCVFLESNV